MLCPPRGVRDPRADAIAAIFQSLLAALSNVASEAGATKKEAQLRAEQVLVALQGSLVVSRRTGDAAVFARALGRIPGIVLGEGGE